MNSDVDLLIIGGGLVGGSLALALRHSGLKIALVEAQTDEARRVLPINDRALALSRGTVQILGALGVWPIAAPKAMAIRHIHVSDRGHFGKARLHAPAHGVEALGHVIVARFLEEAISQKLDETATTRICPARIIGLRAGPDRACAILSQASGNLTVTARLVVAADGGNSTIRNLLGITQQVRDYAQTAIVTEISTRRDNLHTAYERFTPSGPLAVLPLEQRKSSVVWTVRQEEAPDLLQQGPEEFRATLQDAFGYWLGPIALTSRPQGFPLKLIRAAKMTDQRVVLTGNAMHQIHPVAGQGFNLGLRDAAVLAERVETQSRFGGDIGNPDFLAHYEEARSRDLDQVIYFTDSLVRLFSSDLPLVAMARNAGLLALDRIPAAKQFLALHAMGYGFRTG